MNAEAPALRQVQMYGSSGVVIPDADVEPPFRGQVRVTYGSFFEMFDVPILDGRAWTRAEDEEGAALVVLSRRMKERLFGADSGIGESVLINGLNFSVVGVLDYWQPTPRFYHVEVDRFDDTADFFVPFKVAMKAMFLPNGNVNCWQPRMVRILSPSFVLNASGRNSGRN